MRITVANRGPGARRVDLLPTVWFRNTWSWGERMPKPALQPCEAAAARHRARASRRYGQRWLLLRRHARSCCSPKTRRTHAVCYGVPMASRYVKDGINDYVVHGRHDAVNPDDIGTKAAAHYALDHRTPGETVTVRLRLTDTESPRRDASIGSFDAVSHDALREADEFYAHDHSGRPFRRRAAV